MANTELEPEDTQAILASGYGRLPQSRFIFVAFANAGSGLGWLRTVIPHITLATSVVTASARAIPFDTALNLAFTFQGLQMLGLDGQMLDNFPAELIEGMTAPHRQIILGDTGESSPDNWVWGTPKTGEIHAALFLYAATDQLLEKQSQELADQFPAFGVSVVHQLETTHLTERKEHFGFRDGISQPELRPGFNVAPGDRALSPVTPTANPASRTTPDPANVNPNEVPAGEFILGYKNAYDRFPDSPSGHATRGKTARLPTHARRTTEQDFGRNGTYVVFRQLEQRVSEFWKFSLQNHPGATENPNDVEAAIHCAAKMVGRMPNGVPLAGSPVPNGSQPTDLNAFSYLHDDPEGKGCPIGAHIRRSNPRDQLEDTDELLARQITNRHRILRRGRSYGQPVATTLNPVDIIAGLDTTTAAQERGLYFICLNANIQRQFEFVQHTWCNNPKFETLYDEVDAVAGVAVGAAQNMFTIQADPVRQRIANVPRFTRVRGGAYFFMPGLLALQYLTSTL